MKGVGYLISTISVVLLGIVAWQSTIQNPELKPYLIGGVVTAILGMVIRYLAHRRDRLEREAVAEATGIKDEDGDIRPPLRQVANAR